MSAPAITSDTITRGADYSFAFQLRSNQGAPLEDLSTWQWAGVLRNAAGASIADMTVVNNTPEVVSFNLSYTQTQALTAQTGATLYINAIRAGDNKRLQLIRGRISII